MPGTTAPVLLFVKIMWVLKNLAKKLGPLCPSSGKKILR
jgi:hypothetical protein